MNERFIRTGMLLGEGAMARLEAAHVAVFGIGGVGGFVSEALARSGVGELTLIDHDDIGPTNINRQIIALTSTLGRGKAEVMAERANDINPALRVHALRERYSTENAGRFDLAGFDYVVDAIDLVSCKLTLIQACIELGVPVISALGTGNKLDASGFIACDISKTEGCRLARIVRKELRRRGITHHKVVYSPENAIMPREPSGALCEKPPPGRRSIPASAAWVPAAAGMVLAGEVVLDIALGRLNDRNTGR